MKNKTFKIKPISLALLLAGIGLASPSYAVDLAAVEGTWNGITMWGFAADSGACPGAPVSWGVGPQLTDTDLAAGNLTINLRNCLSEPVSIVIPGQPATFTPVRVNGRVTAFTTEAAANGGTETYTWTGVKPGTYLYQSGSHPAMQVQMGLYGALTVGTYAGTSGNVTLLYSEIDPALHNPPTAATPLGYHPRHYLVNGEEIQTSALMAGDTAQPTVLQFLNAGLDFHVPALNSGYMSLVAEDGNPYPFPKQQYSVTLAAGKTIDALWQPATAGDHVIYDRRGNGMVASLTVDTGGTLPNTAPVAVGDGPYDAVVGVPLNVGILDGVLANDSDADGNSLTAVLDNAPTNLGGGAFVLNADGSFSYTPTAAGADSFTYHANDGTSDGTADSNITTVTLNATVAPDNTAPVAVDDAYVADEDTTLNVTASSVLGNDNDADTDTLTAVLDANATNGTITLNTDGTFAYEPAVNFNGSDSFTYHANDGTADSNIATVSITVTQVNDAPAAVDDTYAIDSGADLFVSADDGVLANDSDIDGDTMTAMLVTGPADEDFDFYADGSFTYFSADGAARPSDNFSYRACDASACSDEVTVTITINLNPENTPPVAVPDTANVVRNTNDTFIDLTGNDTDVNDNIDHYGIVITADPNQRGTVEVVANGVNYTPRTNFGSNQGREEEFSYTVRDLSGATSNEVTVTVIVFRRANQFP